LLSPTRGRWPRPSAKWRSRVDDGEHALGEAGDPALQLVGPGEFVAFGGEGVPPCGEFPAAAVDLGGAALPFGAGRPARPGRGRRAGAVRRRPRRPAVESGELGGEEFVVGSAHGDRLLAGEEHVGAAQGGADLGEDEGVEADDRRHGDRDPLGLRVVEGRP
jgi:hypothetical protein